MITKINGVNFWGSPGGTMSQSLSKGTSTSNITYTTIGSIYIDGGYLKDGDLLNIKCLCSKPINFNNDNVEVALFWGTQSTPSTGIQLGYVSFSGDSISLDRSLWFSAGSCNVISTTSSISADYGDLNYEMEYPLIPNNGLNFSSGYLFIAGRNVGISRLKDAVQLEYFMIEPIIYGRSGIVSSTNQGIFLRNGTYSYATDRYPDGSSIPDGSGRSVGFGGFDFSGFLNDGGVVFATTSNSLIASIEMTGRVKDGDLIRVDSRVKKVGTSSGWTQRFYYNTVGDSLTGATLISVRSLGATSIYHNYSRRIFIFSADGTGSGSEVISTSTGYASEYTLAAAMTRSLLSLNWNTTCYLINAVQPSAFSSDTFYCDYISVNTYN